MPERHRERKQALEDEDRRIKFADLHEQRSNLSARLSLIPKDDPNYQKTYDETLAGMTNIQQQMDQLYHPIKAPGALQRDWAFLKHLITRKPNVPPPTGLPAPDPQTPVGTLDTPEMAVAPDAAPDAVTMPNADPAPPLPGRTYQVGGPVDPRHRGGQVTKSMVSPSSLAPGQQPPQAGTMFSGPVAPGAAPPSTQPIPVQPGEAPPPQAVNPSAKQGGFSAGLEPDKAPVLPGATPKTVTGPKALPASETMAVPPNQLEGLVAPGNIPIWNRPVVRNADGSHSTEYTTSYIDERKDSLYYGKEVVVPTIVDGKFLTKDGKKPESGSPAEDKMTKDAFELYKKTGQHLGVFDNSANADKYVELLHSRGERKKPHDSHYEPTSYQRKLQAQHDKAQQEAKTYLAAGPLTPEEEALKEVVKNRTQLQQSLQFYKEINPDATPKEVADFRKDLVAKMFGFTQRPNWKLYTDGKTRLYADINRPETIPPGFMPAQGAPKGGNTAFERWMDRMYPNGATGEQEAAGRRYWAALGAHATTRTTDVDAAGNSTSTSVPDFGAGVPIPPQLREFYDGAATGTASAGAPGDTGSGAAATPSSGSAFAQLISTREGFGTPGTIPTQAKNPGALELGDIGYGVRKAANKQEITVFPTEQAGWDALNNQLNLIFSGKDSKYPPTMTLAEFGQKYSGGDADYGAKIAASMGVDPSTTLGQIGQSQTSSGAAAPPTESGPAGAINASTTAAPSPEEQTGLTSLGLTPSPLIAAPDNPNDALAAQSEANRLGIGNDVKGVAEYRLDPDKVTSARGGQRTKFFELVGRINPAYDQTQWAAVQQARSSFTAKGVDAGILKGLNLSVSHLDKLINTYSALGNSQFPDWNRIHNASRVHTGYGGVSAVDSAATAVSGEMASVFKNSGATDTEIQEWRQNFDHNMSPDAFSQSVTTMTDLMSGRMLGEAQTYVNTFGSLRGFPLLTPETAKILSNVDSDGARQILEVNRQATLASGKRPPAPGQPTTAPPPPEAKQPGPANVSTGTSASTSSNNALKSVSVADVRQQHPELKDRSDDEIRQMIQQQGFVPVR
jgi:hypothetical protein